MEDKKSIVDILRPYSTKNYKDVEEWATKYLQLAKRYIEKYDEKGNIIKVPVSIDEFASECFQRNLIYNTHSVGYGEDCITLNINK